MVHKIHAGHKTHTEHRAHAEHKIHKGKKVHTGDRLNSKIADAQRTHSQYNVKRLIEAIDEKSVSFVESAGKNYRELTHAIRASQPLVDCFYDASTYYFCANYSPKIFPRYMAIRAALCAEDIVKRHILDRARVSYYSHLEYHLPCSIQATIDVNPKIYFIIRDMACEMHLFHGTGRSTYRALRYDDPPELRTYVETKLNINTELAICRRLFLDSPRPHDPTLINVEAIMSRTEKGELVTSIVHDYFNKGHLGLSNNTSYIQQLTADKIVAIAKSTIQALATVHGRDIVHRNMRTSAIYVTDTVREFRASLGSFEHACIESDAKAANKRPSEYLYINSWEIYGDLQQVDYKKADIFALGCALIELIRCKAMPWVGATQLLNDDVLAGHNVALRNRYQDECKKYMEDFHHRETRALKTYDATLDINTNKDALKKNRVHLLAFQLCHPDPAKRVTLDNALQQVTTIEQL